jgi:hypothetical protein
VISNRRATAPVFFCLAALLAGSAPLAALEVHKCVGPDGRVAFQDGPCAQGDSSTLVRLPDDPGADVVPEPGIEAPPPAVKLPPKRAHPIPPAAPSVPAASICVREDGSRYLSGSGRGERRAVPLGMLGIPSGTPATAYGGRDGIGVSAPGLREIPHDRSLHGTSGALFVWVEDPCRIESGNELCSFYAERVDAVQRRLRLAFSDEAPVIRAELESWRLRAAPCRH